MKPRTNEGGGTFKNVPVPAPGSYAARCYSVIQIGTVPNIYQGQVNPDAPTVNKITVIWELPTQTAVFDDEKGIAQPFTIKQDFTFSLGPKANLSKLLVSWRGRPITKEMELNFDPTVMVDRECMLSFIHSYKKGTEHEAERHSGNTYLNLKAIMPLPEGMPCPPMMNEKLVWDWDNIAEGKEQFDINKWNKIWGYIRKQMQESEEYVKYGKHIVEASENNSGTTQPTEPAPVQKMDESGW